MKKTYIKIITQELKQSFGRFMAILGIVALGVGFLSGLLVTTPDMHLSVDEYYDENNMADIFIKATMGLTDKDFEEISSMEEIDEIMPAYVVDTLMETSNSELLATRVYGIPIYSGNKDDVYINQLELIKGRMPQNENECVVERKGSFISDIPINSKLVISDQNDDYDKIDDIYKVKEYTVVGIVSNSFYFSMEREITNIGNGRLGAIIYVDKSSYALDVYTDFYLTATSAMEMDTFSKEYETMTDDIIEKLEGMSKERSKIRYSEVLLEANDKLNEGKEKYEDAKQKAETELADAKKKIDDGKDKLKKAEKDIRDGKKELADGRITLANETREAQIKIDDAKLELADALIELNDGEQELKDAWQELLDGQKKYQDGYIEYLDAKKELEEAQVKFDDGEKEYEDGVKELAKAERKIKRGEDQLEDAESQLRIGWREYNAGITELQSQKAQFEQGVGQYAGGLQEIGISVSSDDLYNAFENNPVGTPFPPLQGIESMVEELKTGIEYLEGQINELENLIESIDDPVEKEIKIEELDSLKKQLIGMKTNLEQLNNMLTTFPKLQYGWKAIKHGESELAYGRRELESGERQYEDGVADLRGGKKEIAKAKRELEEAKVELEDNRKKLTDGWKELEEGRLELEDAKIKLEDGFIKHADGRKELDDGWIEYEDGVNKLLEAEETLKDEIIKANKELADGEIELAKGQVEYNDGLKEISEGEADYLKGKTEADEKLSEAEEEIKDAEKKIADIETPKWYVLGRNSNMSYVSFLMNAEKAAAISKVFPVFFYLVAALVTLTTMTRMVEEERSQIGTLKALGYTKSVIISKYLIYCGLASVLGSVVGLIIGFKLVPYFIWNAYGVMFHLPSFITAINPRIALISAGLAILSTMGATVYAVSNALKEKPSTLMLPRAPKAGKRIMLERVHFIWSRMSFNHKATARNLFRYKKHFFMTVIGISGCTALLVAGFGLRDSIGDVANTQFLEIFKYDISVELDKDKEFDPALEDVIKDKDLVEDSMEIFVEKGNTNFNGKTMDISISVPENSEDLKDFIDLRDRKTGNKIIFSPDSIVITEKAAENMGLKVGDVVNVENDEEKPADFKITHITENYLGNYIYMNNAIYSEAFNDNIKNNIILLKSAVNDENRKDELISKLLLSEKVLNAGFVSESKNTFDKLLTSINYIVLFIIVASGALAFIVLYNLTNININERRKELATLKVLGFYNEEVSAYIFRETIILSIIGMGVGLLLGIILHKFIIVVIEDPEFMFGRTISVLSFGLSAAVTMLFSLIVNVFMLKKLRDIKMVDSMKAID